MSLICQKHTWYYITPKKGNPCREMTHPQQQCYMDHDTMPRIYCKPRRDHFDRARTVGTIHRAERQAHQPHLPTLAVIEPTLCTETSHTHFTIRKRRRILERCGQPWPISPRHTQTIIFHTSSLTRGPYKRIAILTGMYVWQPGLEVV